MIWWCNLLHIQFILLLLNNCIFEQNRVYSYSSLAEGGAIYCSQVKNKLNNCSFDNNTAETFLKVFLVTGDEPRSYGGAIYSIKSRVFFTECKFTNNTGFGNSPLHISSGKGGAFFSENSLVEINKSYFKNNTLVHFGHKFDIECYIEGEACYFSDSNVSISNCDFINNTATLRASEYSIYFSARIYGGAVYSHNTKQALNCSNCIFWNNTVLIPDQKEKEFSGAVCLTNSTLNQCTFQDNSAYNGCDIRYDQIQK